MNTENSKTNEPYKSVLNLSQINMMQNLPIYHTWKNIRK